MSVINANPLMLGDAGYNIGRSLRFRSSASAYLSRTPASATNQTVWTWSKWVKRGSLGSIQTLFDAYTNGSNSSSISFTSADQLQVSNYVAASLVTNKVTSQVFRDPSSWYHIVVSSNGSTSLNIYVNGTQVTSFATNVGPTAANWFFNGANNHRIGTESSGGSPTQLFDGYLAEVNFIDGQALTPSSFGQTDPVTGVWAPKKYTGTYGTNGFYLPFSDNTSATTLAYDKSGNSNNWTPNNISTTAGATYDSMTDVPTLTSATASNFAVMNPLNNPAVATFADGNLKVTNANSDYRGALSTMAIPTSGKFYWEMQVTTNPGASNIVNIGIAPLGIPLSGNQSGYSNSAAWYMGTGTFWIPGGTSIGTSTTSDVFQIAFDASTNKVWLGKNNAWYWGNTSTNNTTGDPANGSNPTFTLTSAEFYAWAFSYADGITANFGQRPFSYTPPTGFKALNTFNLPDPTIKKPNQYMDATLWSGDNTASRNISNAASFQPDLVWVKCRSTAGQSHNVVDSVRGLGTNVMNTLYTEKTDSETGVNTNASLGPYYGAVGAITSTGFTLTAGSGGTTDQVNKTGSTYVGWQWKKGATPGFDIVTYTGTGVARTVSHSLGVAPSMIIVKDRTTAGTSWQTYHKSLGATDAVMLNTTGATFASSVYWNNTAPTASVFTVGTSSFANTNADNYVAYLFAEIPGFSKFGSYTGNGSANGPFVFTNFRPRWIMAKRTDTAGTAWAMFDAVRDIDNPDEAVLAANSTGAETSTSGFGFDFNSNGFKVRATDPTLNASNGTYIFAAFSESPFKYSNAR